MMIALLSAALAAPHVSDDDAARDVHLRLDADVTWGIGSQMYLGAQTQLRAQSPVWQGRATGTLDGTLRLAYGNEALFLAPWIDPEQVTGAGHRVIVQLGVGHTFHLGAKRRTALGLHALGGFTSFTQSYTLTYANEDVSGSATRTRVTPLVSGQLSLSQRLSDRVGLHLSLDAPVPTASTYLIGLAQVGLGVSVGLK